MTVRDLRVTDTAGAEILKGISFDVAPGETVALIGESGSGKSMTAKALMGVLPAGLSASGDCRLGTQPLLRLGDRERRAVSGAMISLLLQDPFTILNPLTTVGTHLAESITAGGSPPGAAIADQVRERLEQVGLGEIEERYPFELSGGMRQRVALAAAIARDPAVLMADEPTTALDATSQRRLLQLLQQSQRARGMSLLLITHDLRVALSMSDRVLVMRHGEIVESGTAAQIGNDPAHSYTAQLLASEVPVRERLVQLRPVPRPALDPAPISDHPSRVSAKSGDLLRVTGLRKAYGGGRRSSVKQALQGVDLVVGEGRSVGIVGGSGSGKTTLARCVLGLVTADAGTIELTSDSEGSIDISDRSALTTTARGAATRAIQCVFQDPYASLNPSHTVGFTLAEAVGQRLRLAGTRGSRAEIADEVEALLDEVQLDLALASRQPGKLSGGQRQRVAIARALAMRPRLLVCDEPVAALDASVQLEILEVFRRTAERGISMLFITHDLAVARQVTQDLVVVCEGEVVERGSTEDVIDAPSHEYTRNLVAAVPTGKRSWLD
ncbi:hypothetical protein BHE97_01465 [Aeromicrobium sp. PE09-221]|nr:hypothetical protein BHE97_01465 [Aeromicrobium sp. PE09-221]